MSIDIFQQCVYDVDNRYVDLTLRPVYNNSAFILSMAETSDYEESDTMCELYLTKEDLKAVIDRLTMELEK